MKLRILRTRINDSKFNIDVIKIMLIPLLLFVMTILKMSDTIRRPIITIP